MKRGVRKRAPEKDHLHHPRWKKKGAGCRAVEREKKEREKGSSRKTKMLWMARKGGADGIKPLDCKKNVYDRVDKAKVRAATGVRGNMSFVVGRKSGGGHTVVSGAQSFQI